MRRAAAGCLLALAVGAAPAAARADDGLSTEVLDGTLGPYRIGATLTIRDHRVVAAGHYFYVAHLSDIPLTGAIHGAAIDLQEPGGGAFHLHLMGGPRAATPVRTFDDATGLAGVWTRDGRTLPVTLGLETAYPGPVPARLYDTVTTAPDAVFEARVRRFVGDVIAGDRRGASGFVAYPLRVDGPVSFRVRSPAELAQRWREVFTPKVAAALRDAVPHDLFVRDGLAMLGTGVVWFSGMGAVDVNRP